MLHHPIRSVTAARVEKDRDARNASPMSLHLSPGMTFAGGFRVVRPLSEGGMGAVYVVEQISTGNQRALKLMHPQLVTNANLRQRFVQEARIGSLIKSDH